MPLSITAISPSMCCVQLVAQAPYVLGYVVLGSYGLLLLAEKTRVSAMLPGHHLVRTVTKAQWVKIALQVSQFTGHLMSFSNFGSLPPGPWLAFGKCWSVSLPVATGWGNGGAQGGGGEGRGATALFPL